MGWQQRYVRFCGRIVVLSILILLLYPFLWTWTVIGTLWFTSAKNCVILCFFTLFPLLFPLYMWSCLILFSFTCFSVTRRRSKMGFPYLVNFQLLWIIFHCLYVIGKGWATLKFHLHLVICHDRMIR